MGLLSPDDLDEWSAPRADYKRRRPENTLLYQIIQEHWPRFKDELERQGKFLPAYVSREFDNYLKCGRLQYGFLRIQCEACHHETLVAFSCKGRICPNCGARRMADSAAHLVDHVFPEKPVRQWVLSVPFQLRYLFATQPQVLSKVLTIVNRVISRFLIKRAGLSVKSGAQTGAVTLIQRFGSALNANPHIHSIYLDGAFNKKGVFYPVKPPTPRELDRITQTIALRVTRYLEKAGYLVRDTESAYLDLQTDDDDPMANIVGASITYRLAFGPNAGRKALTLQTIPPTTPSTSRELVSKQASFSLHAGIACKDKQRKKLERLCRYITRPAISEKRLALASNGNIIYNLKTPYDDGTTHVVLSPQEFIGRLAALIPKPRVNLTRFHGVFAPNSKLRPKVVPDNTEQPKQSGQSKAYAMTWAQRLKRVFSIDIEKCPKCGGKMKAIACIEDPDTIEKILHHLGLDKSPDTLTNRSPPVSLF